MLYGVTTDYEYASKHERDRIEVWSGSFMSVWEAEGYSLPKGGGYMLTTHNGDSVRVECPTPRNERTYQEIDAAINEALNGFYGSD